MRCATGGTHEEADECRRSRNRNWGLRLPGCCFLAPARAPARQHSAMDSGRSERRHPEQPPAPSEGSWIQSTSSRISNSNSSRRRTRGAEQPGCAPAAGTTRTRTKPSRTTGAAGGVPVLGLSVVVAVSMAGLLGGRFCAVACVCAWLAALSRLRRREEATTTAGEVVAVDVDSRDHKEPVVLRGLLERDRRTAVAAA